MEIEHHMKCLTKSHNAKCFKQCYTIIIKTQEANLCEYKARVRSWVKGEEEKMTNGKEGRLTGIFLIEIHLLIYHHNAAFNIVIMMMMKYHLLSIY